MTQSHMQLALAGLVVLSGCAPALSTMTPAETTPARHVRGSVGIGVSVPTGTLGTLFGDAEDLAHRAVAREMLTDAQKRTLISDTAAILFNPPSVSFEVQGRYGISRRFDVGFRFATGALRLDGRFLALPPDNGRIGISVGIGLGYYALEIPVPSPLDEIIEIDDFTRYEIDLPLLAGWTWRFGHLWFGPKLVYTHYSTAMRATFPFDSSMLSADVGGSSFYYGAQIGGAVGYRYVWLAAELSLMGVTGSATLEGFGEKLDVSFGDFVLYPAVALLVQF